MTLTLEIGPDLEAALRETAEREGVPPDHYILKLLKQQLQCNGPMPPRLSREESRILKEINQGLPPATWQRYHELVARRETEELTDAEQVELVALADAVEGWNVRCLELARELAELRGVSWEQTVQEMQLIARRQA